MHVCHLEPAERAVLWLFLLLRRLLKLLPKLSDVRRLHPDAAAAAANPRQ